MKKHFAVAAAVLIGVLAGWGIRLHVVHADGTTGFSLIIQNGGAPKGAAVILNCDSVTINCAVKGGVVGLSGIAGGGGISQLTQDVLAGPGTGAQAATVVGTNGALLPKSAPTICTNSRSQIVNTGCAGGGASVMGTYYVVQSGSEYGPVFPMTDPSGLSLTNINFGGSTSSTASGNAWFFRDTSAPSTNNLRGQVITAPSTPYTITMAYIPQLNGQNAANIGMLWGDSVTSTYETFFIWPSNQIQFTVWHWSNVNSPSVIANYGDALAMTPGLIWMKLSDDGTTKQFCAGGAPVGMVQIYSEASTAFLAVTNQVGWGMNNFQSGGLLVLGWTQGAIAGC